MELKTINKLIKYLVLIQMKTKKIKHKENLMESKLFNKIHLNKLVLLYMMKM